MNLRLFEYKNKPWHLIVMFVIIEVLSIVFSKVICSSSHLDRMEDIIMNVVVSQFLTLAIYGLFFGLIASLQEED